MHVSDRDKHPGSMAGESLPADTARAENQSLAAGFSMQTDRRDNTSPRRNAAQ